MNYSDQYKSPKWQKKRLEMLELADYTCEECGADDKQLHVHHVKYDKNCKVWEYDKTELIVLCNECHEKRHDILDSIIVKLSFMQYDELDMMNSIAGIYANKGFEGKFSRLFEMPDFLF